MGLLLYPPNTLHLSIIPVLRILIIRIILRTAFEVELDPTEFTSEALCLSNTVHRVVSH